MAQTDLLNQFYVIIIAFCVLILAIIAFAISIFERIIELNQKNSSVAISKQS